MLDSYDQSTTILHRKHSSMVTNVGQFRFENPWLTEPGVKEVIQHVWMTGSDKDVMYKIQQCTGELK